MNEIVRLTDAMLPYIVLRIGRFAMVMQEKGALRMGVIPKRLFAKRKDFLEGRTSSYPLSPLSVAKMMLGWTRPDILPKQFAQVLDYIESREYDIWCRYRIRDVRVMLRNIGRPTFGKSCSQSDRHRLIAIASLIPYTRTPDEARLRCFRNVPANAIGMCWCLNQLGLPNELAIFILTFM